MNLLLKLQTAFRARQTEYLERQVNRHAPGILGQELRDAERALTGAREELALRVAERKGLQRQLQANENEQATLAQKGRELVTLGQNGLAQSLAERWVERQQEADELKQQIARAESQEQRLVERLRRGTRELKQYQLRSTLLKAGSAWSRSDGREKGFDQALRELQETTDHLERQHGLSADRVEAREEVSRMMNPEQAGIQVLADRERSLAVTALLEAWESPDRSSDQGRPPSESPG